MRTAISELLKIFKSVGYAASTDAKREKHSCLQVFSTNGRIEVLAGDGEWIARYIYEGDCEAKAPVVLPLKSAALIVTMLEAYCKSTPIGDGEEVEFAPATCSIEHDAFTLTPPVWARDDTYPDLAAPFKNHKPSAVEFVALSPRTLAKVAKGFQACGAPPDVAVDLSFGRDASPALATLEEIPDFVALVYPPVRGAVECYAKIAAGMIQIIRCEDNQPMGGAVLKQICLLGSGAEETPIRELAQQIANREQVTLAITVRGSKGAPICVSPEVES
jgi:hypothetical protein